MISCFDLAILLCVPLKKLLGDDDWPVSTLNVTVYRTSRKYVTVCNISCLKNYRVMLI